ncbi:hypothetical protein K490DRAFT_50654 [Saccharata proteae CBS 121410]|uniref:Spindle pole body component n=1 Tax=Saccharata proteae CBS 121410 TaxID=1314787 RepID=A0A9P4HN20_9PEZI|nr:hypothetical protein K490DRAFT_50654 [Saccharata proteae CBS 121410]
MLHEILLSLSGHPSSLFDAQPTAELNKSSLPLLSPPEAQLLSSVGRLAGLHRSIRTHAGLIASSHGSTICRAVGTAITSTHLARFQQKILEVEARILRQDASIVGAYNIVPLAAIVSEFDDWLRRMEWLSDLCDFMLPQDSGKSKDAKRKTCTGAGIIDKLRQEAQTGWPEIGEGARELSKVAETAWLRQLSSWVLYGRLPSHGGEDFFVHHIDDGEFHDFISDSKLLPKFVSSQTASSILFIGRSLDQIRSRHSSLSETGSARTSELELLPTHLRFLSDIEVPITSAALSEAVSAIRLSLSRNLLQQLLPLPKILQILSLLQEFFLLGRGEFAVTLIEEADERVRSRHRRPAQSKAGQWAQSLLIKEAEVTAVLTRTWTSLSALVDNEEDIDEGLDLARSLVHLSLTKPSPARPPTPGRAKEGLDNLPKLSNVVFNDLLFPVPTSLGFEISPPLDLFLTSSDMEVYAAINAYLLSVRRAHLRLADMWRQSNIRRDHPAPLGPPQSNSRGGQQMLKERRVRARARAVKMRKVWASCSAAVFLLSESAAYFEGEVVQESWKHFQQWVVGGPKRPSQPASDAATSTAHLPLNTSIPRTFLDPELLSRAHRSFLAHLTHALLLTDAPYTHSLRTLLTHIDSLVALISRLQTIQRNIDLENDEGVVDAMQDYGAEEKEVERELDRARKRVDSGMKGVVRRLRELDGERVGGGVVGGGEGEGEWVDGEAFVPGRGGSGGIDRLLMKLDFGVAGGEEVEEVEIPQLLP